MTETERVLFDFISENFDIDSDDADYTVDVNLFDYGFVDSLGATEIVVFIEEHWDIEITQRDLTLYSMNTIAEIADVVDSKIGA